MQNRFFNNRELETLLDFNNWRLITADYAECAPVSPPEDYRQWIKTNSHSHYFREMFFVLSGETFCTLNNVTYRCSPGTLFLIDSNVQHDWYYPRFAGNFTHVWFMLLRKVMRGKCIQNNNLRKSIDAITSQNYFYLGFVEKWDHLREASKEEKQFAILEVKYAWGALISTLCSKGFNSPTGLPTKESESRKVIEVVVDHIRETAGKSLDWDTLAHFAGYSKYHFGKLFKKYTGQTVHEFINMCRLERVRELKMAHYSQKKMAEELGFSCPAAFSRWLRDNASSLK